MSSGDTVKWWMTLSADRVTAEPQPARVATADGVGVVVVVGAGAGTGALGVFGKGVWVTGLAHAASVRTVSMELIEAARRCPGHARSASRRVTGCPTAPRDRGAISLRRLVVDAVGIEESRRTTSRERPD